MTYKKISVDNLTCKRRFHLSFDDAASPQALVTAQCPHCQVRIYERKNHPPVTVVREENLVTTTNLSSLQTKECDFYERHRP